MLALTVGLGIWQLERLAWKRGLLAEIDRAEAAPPVTLPDDPAPFEKVELRGRMRDDLLAYYGSEVRSTTAGVSLGAQLITPLERHDGPPVLIDRGWVPDGAPAPVDPGEATVVGYVRPPEYPSWSSPATDLAAKRFWSLDPAAIGSALGLAKVAPFTVVALGQGGSPEPASALPRPPNDHLGYAITWFGLAACLVVVFVAYARRTLRP
jgi:surfeit locus 1 family protein